MGEGIGTGDGEVVGVLVGNCDMVGIWVGVLLKYKFSVHSTLLLGAVPDVVTDRLSL